MIPRSIKYYRKCDGFTIMELFIALAMMGILVAVAVPSMSSLFEKRRLISATEQVYGHLQQARSESIARSTDVFVNFKALAAGETTWRYGFSQKFVPCDPDVTTLTDTTACVIVIDDADGTLDLGDGALDTGDLVLTRFLGTDFEDVIMSVTGDAIGFQFDSRRGMLATASGPVNLQSANGQQLRVAVSLLGSVSICTPSGSVVGYTTC